MTVGLDTGEQFESMYDLLMGNGGPSTKDQGSAPITQGNEGPEVVVIRHGDTKFTEEDLSHGWSDESLSDNGRAEVNKQQLKDRPDVLVSSDLKRAKETAEILSKNHEIPFVESNPDFRTWDIGKLQGMDCKQVNPLLDKYVKNSDNPVPGGESFNDFKSRVVNGMTDLQNEYPGIKVGLVTHSKVQKMLDHLYEGKDFINDTSEKPADEKTMTLGAPFTPYPTFADQFPHGFDWTKFEQQARPSDNIEDDRPSTEAERLMATAKDKLAPGGKLSVRDQSLYARDIEAGFFKGFEEPPPLPRSRPKQAK